MLGSLKMRQKKTLEFCSCLYSFAEVVINSNSVLYNWIPFGYLPCLTYFMTKWKLREGSS